MINCSPHSKNNLTLFFVGKNSNVRRLHLGFNNRVIGDAAHASTVRVDRARFRRCIDYSSARSFHSRQYSRFTPSMAHSSSIHFMVKTRKSNDHFILLENLGGNDSSNLAKENQCDFRPFLRSTSFHEKRLACKLCLACYFL